MGSSLSLPSLTPCSQRLRGHTFFANRYLCENEKVRETVFANLYGAQVESFKQKMVKNLVTLSLLCGPESGFALESMRIRNTGSNQFCICF